MGFALWLEGGTAWAQGTHEYRPMGTAVMASRCVFTPRDFHRRRVAPSRFDPRFVGLFASLGEMNDWLQKLARRKSRSRQDCGFVKKSKSSVIPPF